jgi:tetratricopeptide (TPR) repeat protein
MTLADNGQRRQHVFNYLDLLRAGKPAAAAAREAFGMSFGDLDQKLWAYSRNQTLPALFFSGSVGDLAAVAIERVRESEVLLLQGRLLLEHGAYDDAEPLLIKARALDPDGVDVRVAMARLHVAQNRTEQGLTQLRAIAAEAPTHFGAQYYAGAALAKTGQYTEALDAYDRAVKITRGSAAAWFGLSLSTLALGRISQSDAAMTATQQLESSSSWHYSRALAAFNLGRHETVLQDARKYVALAGPGDSSAPYAAFLGIQSARRLARDADATELLAQLIPALPAKSWPLQVAEHMQGKLTDQQLLDRAGNNGERTEAHTYIALAALLAGRTDDAKTHLVWVRDKGDRNYTEYDIAVAALKKILDPG